MRHVLLAVLLFLAPSLLKATGCDAVTVSGYANWPPYSFQKNGQLVGAGVDIASRIFEQLDIPVRTEVVENPAHLYALLAQGKIDVLVATFDTPAWQQAVTLVQPGYFEDVIAVAVAKDKTFSFERWYDLMGRTGVTVSNIPLGAQFADFAKQHLAIEEKPDAVSAFSEVGQYEADYFVGSGELLRSYLIQHNAATQFQILPNLVGPEKVYLAFSKNSPCQVYLPFASRRLTNLIGSKTVEQLLERYAIE
jgi:polar amino acid transport system substrate-binding protein